MDERRRLLLLIFTLIGMEVGLGNLWRFPYLSLKYGLGFVLFNFIFLLLFGIPFFVMESSLGVLLRQKYGQALERVVGVLSVWPFFANAFVTVYYSVITAWPVVMVAHVLGLQPDITPVVLVLEWVLAWLVVKKGLNEGIGVVNTVSMVLLLATFAVLVPYLFLTHPFHLSSFAKSVQPSLPPSALGQVFFSLTLGTGSIYTFSRLLKRQQLWKVALTVSLADFAVSVVAMLFFYLLFSSLPVHVSSADVFEAVKRLPLFPLLPVAVYVLFFLAGFTSLISSMESLLENVFDKGERAERVSVLVAVLGGLSLLLAVLNYFFPVIDLFDYVGALFILLAAFLMVVLAHTVSVKDWKKLADGDVFLLLTITYAKFVVPLGIIALIAFVVL